GDISASSDDWMRNLNSKQIQKGRVFDLDTRLRAFYSFTNKTNKPIITDIFYNDLRNNNLKFTIKQMPLEGDTLVYKPLKQSLPVINDGKWYLIRTERARDYKASFLGAKYHDSANLLVGLQPLSKLSDSLLWTVESIGENVILRNKALGYLDMTLYDRFLKFQLTKPTTGFKMIENQGRNGHNVLGAAFQGTTSSVKGLHMSVTDFVFGDYFSLTDNSTFFFEEFDIDYIISYGSEYLISVNIGTEIGNTSDVAYNRLLDALSNANYKARGLSMAGQRPYLVEITNAIEQVKNDIVMPLTSTEENPVWYRINRYETDFWKFLDEDIKQYLNVTEIGQPLQKSNLDVNSGKFLFRFEITDNGMLKIIPKSFRNYMLSSASSTITITKESSVNTNFDIVPIMTRYGVNFAIRGREIYNGYYFITFKGGEENIVRSLGMSSAGLPNNSKIL
ncbi:MAG: hypothetical protein Q8T08_04280, partial [Ignavibacteria bacterium]|nr:hypothetical protein [Ignavibacteria bacterium]